MDTKNIILLGAASRENNNRGCQALTIGALSLICKSLGLIHFIQYSYFAKINYFLVGNIRKGNKNV